jgi:glutaredoxin
MKIIYGIPNCPHCKDAMKKADDNGEKFRYIDVTKDDEALNKLRKLRVMSFPYIEVEE